MELKTYIYECAYNKTMDGKSIMLSIAGGSVVAVKSGKAIWVRVARGGKDILFCIPISRMYNLEKVPCPKYEDDGKDYIKFQMMSGIHRDKTFGKKDDKGKPMFKPKPACWRCRNYEEKEYSGKTSKSSSSRAYSRKI
ncbi:MAG: hypothetical protein EU529_05870 [Promethearchaeota archaeon]|nr:MAG: hypothetical protein EU529_05870 [Candidatus Lokiarchaeota archaeon]